MSCWKVSQRLGGRIIISGSEKDKRDAVDRWAKHVRGCVISCQTLKDGLEEERKQYESIEGTLKMLGSSSANDCLRGFADLIGFLERSLESRRVEIEVARRVFASLQSHDFAGEIMALRHLQRKTFDDIALETSYSVAQVKRIASAATLECYDLMPAEYRIEGPNEGKQPAIASPDNTRHNNNNADNVSGVSVRLTSVTDN